MARLPTIFIPHGGGPWPLLHDFFPKPEIDALGSYLRALPDSVGTIKAVLVISGHWETKVPTVESSPHPPLLFDYYGFPPETYQLKWPAPGSPPLAARVCELLTGAGFQTAADAERGYDHGAFVPLMVAWPNADVPTVQLSLLEDLDPQRHLQLGRALAPLRDEGVLILGSGMSYHNMRGFRSGTGAAESETFDRWLREAATAPAEEREAKLLHWADAPAARLAHPREEHLLPLHVVVGAAGKDAGRVEFDGTFGGMRISAFRYE